MSTTVEQKQLTVAQRTSEAARLTAELLGLDDVKRVAAAMAEAAAEGVRRNPHFASLVRTLYEQTAPRTLPRRTSTVARAKKATPDVPLVPIKYIPGHEADSAAPPDPYFLIELYGREQLPLALSRYTTVELREAVKLVRGHHPEAKPSGTSRMALLDYIVQHIETSN